MILLQIFAVLTTGFVGVAFVGSSLVGAWHPSVTVTEFTTWGRMVIGTLFGSLSLFLASTWGFFG